MIYHYPFLFKQIIFGVFFVLLKTFYFVLGYSWLANNVVIVSGEQLRDSALHRQVSIVPETPHPPRLTHTIEQSFTIQLYYTVGPCWSISNIAVCTQSVSQSVQSLSRVWLFATPWTAACQASLSLTNFQRLLKLMSIESVMPSNYLILCHPLLLLPLIFPSVRVFSSESVLHIKWPKYWSFSFSISPSS